MAVEILAYYALFTLAFTALLVISTLILMRRDKHYALALSFCEICIYIAVTTFGATPLSKAVISVGGVQAALELKNVAQPSGFVTISGIFLCGFFATIFMTLRTWDKQIPRNPNS